MDERLVSLVALFDFLAAFDTLDYSTLLEWLLTTYGVRGTVLDWFVFYLSGHFQSVIVDGVVSASHPLVCAPGYCIRPSLFYFVLSASVRCNFCLQL